MEGMNNSPIERAVQYAGGISALATLIGVRPPTVHEWKTGVRPVPIKRCVGINKATNGAITLQELRPNDWQQIWPELPPSQLQPANDAIKPEALAA